jgi:DNA polymerase-1
MSPAWEARLGEPAQARAVASPAIPIIPRSPQFYAERIVLVADREGAEAMLDLARQRPITSVGFDCEYRHRRPGVPIGKSGGKTRWWYDPRSIVPLLASLVLVEPQPDGRAVLYRFVIDVRRPEVLEPLARVLRLPIPLLAHFAQGDLFCLWALGLPTPDRIWDTCIAERAFQLGLFHVRYQTKEDEGEGAEARRKADAEEDSEFSCKLVPTCVRRGVPYPFAAAKDRLQQSFLTHPDNEPFSREQLEYAVADAEAVARLYPVQVQEALARNALHHLEAVEMGWTITDARMIWDGVRVDPGLCRQLGEACRRHVTDLTGRLVAMGLGHPNSHPELVKFSRSVGLLDAFREGGKFTFDDDHLAAVEHRHSAIPLIRAYRKSRRLLSDPLLTGALVGADGRLHPDHRQLGAESGRNTMRHPNIGGVGKALRPLVVPETADWAIGEVDLSQIEVLIAAAESGDPDLIAMVKGRDVYCAMVRGFYADRLSPEERALSDKELKKRFRDLRDVMKVCTLAVIYNITPFGLSHQLGISAPQAAEVQAKFLTLFPVLARALREASAYGAIRGYAVLCTGLRRYRARAGQPTPWEVNWLRNTPIQGSASVVFKAAGNRLFRRYQFHGARLLLPLHDAYVFECPRERLEAVAALTAEVMKGAVQEYYPMLDPQVEVNIEQPHCWNKDGKSRSLELWMEDPEQAR